MKIQWLRHKRLFSLIIVVKVPLVVVNSRHTFLKRKFSEIPKKKKF